MKQLACLAGLLLAQAAFAFDNELDSQVDELPFFLATSWEVYQGEKYVETYFQILNTQDSNNLRKQSYPSAFFRFEKYDNYRQPLRFFFSGHRVFVYRDRDPEVRVFDVDNDCRLTPVTTALLRSAADLKPQERLGHQNLLFFDVPGSTVIVALVEGYQVVDSHVQNGSQRLLVTAVRVGQNVGKTVTSADYRDDENHGLLATFRRELELDIRTGEPHRAVLLLKQIVDVAKDFGLDESRFEPALAKIRSIKPLEVWSGFEHLSTTELWGHKLHYQDGSTLDLDSFVVVPDVGPRKLPDSSGMLDGKYWWEHFFKFSSQRMLLVRDSGNVGTWVTLQGTAPVPATPTFEFPFRNLQLSRSADGAYYFYSATNLVEFRISPTGALVQTQLTEADVARMVKEKDKVGLARTFGVLFAPTTFQAFAKVQATKDLAFVRWFYEFVLATHENQSLYNLWNGTNPLIDALQAQDEGQVRLLLGAPNHFETKRTEGGRFNGPLPFTVAVATGNVALCRLLVEAGADPLALDATLGSPAPQNALTSATTVAMRNYLLGLGVPAYLPWKANASISLPRVRLLASPNLGAAVVADLFQGDPVRILEVSATSEATATGRQQWAHVEAGGLQGWLRSQSFDNSAWHDM